MYLRSFSRGVRPLSGRGKRVESIVQDFVRSNAPDVTGAAVASPRGLPIAVAVGPEVDPRMLSAQLAAIVSAQDRIVSQLGLGDMRTSTVEADRGSLVVRRTGEYIIGVLIGKDANLGLILIELDRLSNEISEVLSAG
ncbi:MAG: roadblock/LC7 domain-containing protein [Candidatus Korarchaeota archaeon]|nr:roadblock/LC7 domain-containing protein [Candidatus Korarchaeota archaeon]